MKEQTQTQKKTLIFLTGFMGSGKSTIGPILANTLGYRYIDVDKYIEEKVKKRISEIFNSDGEQAFRILERNTLEELIQHERCVISLGGGTIANEQNCRLVSQNGVLVYLKLSPKEIIERVQHRSDRPMLKDADGNQLTPSALEKRVIDLLDAREPFYMRSDVVIYADDLSIGVTVDEIMKKIRDLIKQE
jgi:shikimate kinase